MLIRKKIPFQGSIIKVSAEVQPAFTADCENVGFMPSIEIGGQFVPLETMGMPPSRSVSVLDINFPRSYPFGTPTLIRREEDPATYCLTSALTHPCVLKIS